MIIALAASALAVALAYSYVDAVLGMFPGDDEPAPAVVEEPARRRRPRVD